MIILRASHAGWPKVHLRVVVYVPLRDPRGLTKLVVQVVENGEPIVEDPVREDFLPAEEVEAFLAASRDEGWVLVTEGTAPAVAETERSFGQPVHPFKGAA